MFVVDLPRKLPSECARKRVVVVDGPVDGATFREAFPHAELRMADVGTVPSWHITHDGVRVAGKGLVAIPPSERDRDRKGAFDRMLPWCTEDLREAIRNATAHCWLLIDRADRGHIKCSWVEAGLAPVATRSNPTKWTVRLVVPV